MGTFRKLWDRLNGDRDDRDDFAERMDAAKARGVARRAGMFDPLPALSHYKPREPSELDKLKAENARLTARVAELERDVAMYRALF